MKKKIMLSIVLSLVCAGVLYANGIGYLGLELRKKAANNFVLTDGNGAELPNDSSLSFSTPVNKAGTIEPKNTQKFGVRYSIETKGTLLVFFSGKSDLGYYDIGATNYNNPWMMESAYGTKGLNYRISVDDTADSRYSGSFPYLGAQVEITGLEVFPKTPPVAGGVDPIINSGYVFKKYIEGVSGTPSTGTINFTLSMERNTNETFESGLYYGYVIVHFNVN